MSTLVGTGPAPAGLVLDLPRRGDAAGRARAALHPLLAPLAGEDDLRADALLVVSELVTNAVLHGDGEVRLEVVVRHDAVLVAVCDDGADGPVQRAAARGAEGGRGIALVDAVSTAWGVESTATGKRVWAHLPRQVRSSPSLSA